MTQKHCRCWQGELVPEVRCSRNSHQMQLHLVKGAMNWSSRPLFCDLRAQHLAPGLGLQFILSFSRSLRTGCTWGPAGPVIHDESTKSQELTVLGLWSSPVWQGAGSRQCQCLEHRSWFLTNRTPGTVSPSWMSWGWGCTENHCYGVPATGSEGKQGLALLS